MSLNWRDDVSVAATVLLLAAIGSSLVGLPLMQMEDWRPAILLTLLLGIAVYVVIGPTAIPMRGPVFGAISRLGLLAVLFGMLGMVMGSQLLFVLLCVTLILLWTLVTIYHLHLHEK